MTRLFLASLVLASLLGLVGPQALPPSYSLSQTAETSSADNYTADLELANRFVPVFYFHPDEIYFPQPVDIIMGISRLRQSKRMWFDTSILNKFSVQDLYTLPSDSTFFLDQWFGDTGSSEYANYSSHKEIYQSTFSPEVGGPQPMVYAHVVHHQDPEYTSIQYWIFYFYNDWFNKHEGDWEMVEVILLAGEQPGWVIYSQHHGGVRRSWSTTPLEDGSHPMVYVARGSHANYFVGGEAYVYKQDIGNRQLLLVDRTGSSMRVIPAITLLPTRAELNAEPGAWPGAEWLQFRGRWGETAVYGDFNGPYGPADKGFQWDDPYSWGISQPLDQDTWYKNRLRVEVAGSDGAQAQIWLTDTTGQAPVGSETIDNLAILHTDPPGKVLAQVESAPGSRIDITVYWPDRTSGMVTRNLYAGVLLDAAGHTRLEISSDHLLYQYSAKQLALSPSSVGSYAALWDAPDSVLVSSTLPFQEILVGLLLSIMISLVPVLFLAAILYWVDRYHKGRIKYLALAFVWGAIPALVIAFSIQLFFKLPPNLIGPRALEVIRLGVLAPVLEEILKAAGLLFIFWRYRRAMNDVLDGMIYGAMVGFGFAFISNLFRYAGEFISLGFPALNLSFVAERTVHVLNHGLYTGIFGAVLGLALMFRKRLKFWLVVSLGLVFAIATHALQNLLSNSLVGINVFTVVVTSAGTLLLWAVATWSIVKQHRVIRSELQGRVDDLLYTSVQNPLSRLQAQWNALRRDGLRSWLTVRRLQGLCINLAYLRLQERISPTGSAGSGEAEVLQAEISRLFNLLHPVKG